MKNDSNHFVKPEKASEFIRPFDSKETKTDHYFEFLLWKPILLGVGKM